MGAIGASVFLFRDFIQYILPTVILVCLFVPFFKGDAVEATSLIFLAIISGYIIYSPAEFLARKFQSLLPNNYINLTHLKKWRRWWGDNWDYGRLWLLLGKDERDYLYLTGSYFEFYRLAGFYLCLYSFLNLGYLIFGLTGNWASMRSSADFFAALFAANTQFLGGLNAPTLYVIVIAAILGVYSLNNAAIEYEILFVGEDGFYVNYAKLYHENHGWLATSVWGTVFTLQDGLRVPVDKVTVTLYRHDGHRYRPFNCGRTNEDGYFQMPHAFAQCVGVDCKVKITDPHWQGGATLTVTEKTVPYFEVTAVRRRK